MMPQPDANVQPLDPVAGEGVRIVQACLAAGHEAAWEDLYLFVVEGISPCVHAVLQRAGVARSETEAVVLEFFERLWDADCRRLRSCQATTDAPLCAWLRSAARRYTRDWLKRRGRCVRREGFAATAHGPPDRSGPDESDVASYVEDSRPLISDQDYHHLRVLVNLETPNSPVSPRTLRRWRQELFEKHHSPFWQRNPPGQDNRRGEESV